MASSFLSAKDYSKYLMCNNSLKVSRNRKTVPVLLRRRLRPREVQKFKLVSDRVTGEAGFPDSAGLHQVSRLIGLDVPHLLWLQRDAQRTGMVLWGQLQSSWVSSQNIR